MGAPGGLRPPAPPPARGDEDVADDPAVIGAVPATPEGQGGVVVGHAADHVFRWVNPVYKGPKTEESPGNEEFQPDYVQVEVGKHTQLPRGKDGPVWVSLGDCYCIDIVEHKLHAEQGETKADGVHRDARSSE